MPIIPRMQNPGPLANAPAPVLDHAQRPQVNLGGVIQAVGSLGRAGQMPLDNTDVTAGWRALGAVGQAVLQTGSVMGAVAAKRQEARDDTAAMNLRGETEVEAAKLRALATDPNNKDPNAFGAMAQESIKSLQARLADMQGLSSSARNRLSIGLDTFAKTHAIEADSLATKLTFANARDASLGAIDRALANRDFGQVEALKTQATNAGYFGDEHAARVESAVNNTRLQDLGNVMQSFALDGNENGIAKARAEAGRIPGVTDAHLNVMEQTARLHAQATNERNANKAQADFYGNIVLTMEQNPQAIVPAQIDQWAKDKKLNPIEAANLRRAAVDHIGAAPGEFGEFLTQKVLAYDPTQDTTGGKKADLMREAAVMGLSNVQAGQFNEQLNKAIRLNATGGGRAETSILKYGLEHIDAMHKSGDLVPYKTEQAAADKYQFDRAMSDTVKLQRLGFEKTTATSIKDAADKGQYDRARELFFQFAPTRKVDDKEFAKLTPYEQKFFGDVIKTYGRAVKGVDAAKEDESAAKAAELKDAFEAQLQSFMVKNKRPPTAEEARGMVGDLTKPFQDHGSWKVFTAPKVSAASPDKVGIRGFEPAVDLAVKLPTPLASHAQDFIDAGRKYNLDPYSLAAISMHETGNGKSSAFENKNNAMGVSDDNGPVAFKSVRESIMHQARSLAESDSYKGRNTLDQIGDAYAPTTGATNDSRNLNRFWKAGVTAYYNQLRN